MLNRDAIKSQIDMLPEPLLAKVLEFIDYQKFIAGIYDNDTDYLSSVSGVKESIIEGLKIPLSECSRSLE